MDMKVLCEWDPKTGLGRPLPSQNGSTTCAAPIHNRIPDCGRSSSGLERGGDNDEDTMYYRTKWPWPLKVLSTQISLKYSEKNR